MNHKRALGLTISICCVFLLGTLVIVGCGPAPTTPVLEVPAEEPTVSTEGVTESQSPAPAPTPTTGVAEAFEIPTPEAQAMIAAPQAIAGWLGEYYDNTELSGDAALIRDDTAISFDWGTGAPAEELPADQFSIRWTRTTAFEAGSYRFSVNVDDGVRLWLDGELLIDEWHPAADVTYSVEEELDDGDHVLRIEYYEQGGAARIRFWWERLDDQSDTNWVGFYYDNADLAGEPILQREDPVIDFVWERSAPANLPPDEFSARWTRVLTFDPATYRFHVVVDDGVRLWIDGQLVLDEWEDGAPRELTVDYVLHRAPHELTVEYYESGGHAQIQVWWEEIGSFYVDWMGEYWPNRSLNGAPDLVENVSTIDFNWGEGSPAGGIPVDRFSARWTREMAFEAGIYRFHVVVDDGARLWVDNQLLIDEWEIGGARHLTADATLRSGEHELRAEYFEQGGLARMHLWWERIGNADQPTWLGSYYANMSLGGSPSLQRQDETIDFDWGTNPPASALPADRFSVRWERWVTFGPDDYTFFAQADNGIRFYLDDELLIDEWYTNAQQLHEVELYLEGSHYLVVEYYDNAGPALARFWWEGMVRRPPNPQ